MTLSRGPVGPIGTNLLGAGRLHRSHAHTPMAEPLSPIVNGNPIAKAPFRTGLTRGKGAVIGFFSDALRPYLDVGGHQTTDAKNYER